MNIGLFAMLAGFLLPMALFVRLAGQVVRGDEGWSHPTMLWRLQIMALLTVPIGAALPAVSALFSAQPSATGTIILRFGETRTGIAVLIAKIGAVLLVDATLPRVLAQLDRPPITEVVPSRAYLARDVGVILICLGLAWAATWWSAR